MGLAGHNEHHTYSGIATDVYDERTDENIPLFLQVDDYGSLIIDDSPIIDGGSFNIIIENRSGIPYLVVWDEERFGKDPRHTIRLDTGEIE